MMPQIVTTETDWNTRRYAGYLDAARVFSKHENIALQLSGGKDSVCALYYLSNYVDRFTVYWMNTGDALPETIEIINRCKAICPNFVEVTSDVKTWRDEFGTPSDLTPTSSTPIGRALGFGAFKVSDRFSCCFTNIMKPMHDRMIEDGVTCIIRGQKRCDSPKQVYHNGEFGDGFEFFYPLENWTHQEVLDYLKERGAPIHPCYKNGVTGVDCAHCTAWWNESHFGFIKERHPEVHKDVMAKLRKIRTAVRKHLRHLPR